MICSGSSKGALLWAPAYLFLILITSLAFYGLAGFEDSSIDLSLLSDPYTIQILKFSLQQAILSALLSLIFALPIARAIYRVKPRGSGLFLKLSLLAFVMPTLVLITGAVLLLGPQGMLRSLIGPEWSLYGLSGILFAHVYLNMPLAVRILTQQYAHIPDRSVRLARQLKLSGWQRFRLIELPSLKPALIVLFGLIFVLCFNSFAIVLALGGGPGATTFELAIYQALKYDFNLSEALTLAWMQFAIAGTLFLLISSRNSFSWLSSSRGTAEPQSQSSLFSSIGMRVFYLLGWVFLLAPLIALISGINFNAEIDLFSILSSLGRSLLIAFSASGLALALSLLLLLPIRDCASGDHYRIHNAYSWLSTHTLVAPAMVLSTGIYIFLLPLIDLERWSLLCLIVLNLVVLVPFLVSQLKAPFLQYDRQYRALSRNLKLGQMKQIMISLPYLKRSLISTFSLGLLLALGDVSIFAIFGQYESPTLPWLIYRYAGSYRMDEAALASIVLLVVCLLLLLILERDERND